MSYNISFSIAAVIIGVILVTILFINYSSTNLLSNRFKAFLCSTIGMYALNILTAWTDSVSTFPAWANYVLNSLYFSASNAVAFLFLFYVVSLVYQGDANRRPVRIITAINLGLVGVNTIMLVVNAFTGAFFYFEKGAYEHGPAYLAINVISLLFVFESMAFFIIRRKNSNLRQKICSGLFYAIFFASYALQVFVFPDTLLSDFGTAIGALIVFFSIETPDYVKLMATLNELNELKASLEIQVQMRTKELDEEKQSYEELTLDTLSSLAKVIDAKDHYTNGHSFRVAAYAHGLAKSLGMDAKELEQIYLAGLIHDVGKIGISETIITKPGKLDFKEYEIIKSHSALGGDILKGIKRFKMFEEVARNHHERYDGNGYPDKLKGEEIPYAARIVMVCDAFDAMTSDRSYRKALSDKVAIQELIDNKGTQFDPALADAFIALCNSFPDSIRNHIDELKWKDDKVD